MGKSAVGMLLSSALICGMYRELRLQKKRTADYDLLKKQNEYYKIRYEEMEKQWEKLRRIRHELGNRHILALSYVENRRYEELGKLCRSGIEELGAALPVINTGNIGIDSIVSFKLRQAAKQNTGVEREIRLAGKVLIGDADLNSLLGNLFDNALEACARIPADERKICFKLSSDETAFYFQMANRFDGRLKRGRKGELVTVNGDRGRHGIGLKTIKRIVVKYQGELWERQEESWFAIRGILYFENGERES